MHKPRVSPEGTTIDVSIPKRFIHHAVKHPAADWVKGKYREVMRDCLHRHGIEYASVHKGDAHQVEAFTNGIPWMQSEELVATCVAASMVVKADDRWEEGEPAERAHAQDSVALARGKHVDHLPPCMLAMEGGFALLRPFWPERGWEWLTAAQSHWADLMAADRQVVDAKVTDFNSYMAIRRTDFGFDGIDILMHKSNQLALLEGSPLPDHVLRFQGSCCEFMILINDLLSFGKEHFAGDMRNAIQVLVNLHGTSLQDAVDQVCRRLNAAESAILALSRDGAAGQLNGKEKDEQVYYEAWKYFIAGFLTEHLKAARYHGKDYTWTGDPPVRIALFPDRSIFHYV